MSNQSTDLLLQRALDNCTQDPDTWTVLYRDEALAMAKEIHQLRLDLAQQTANATSVLQAQHERDCAVEAMAELAETLRVVRNTQGGRFGLDWPTVERMVNQALSPTPANVSGGA